MHHSRLLGISNCWSARCPETPQKRDARSKNEIGMNLGNLFAAATHMLVGNYGAIMKFTHLKTSQEGGLGEAQKRRKRRKLKLQSRVPLNLGTELEPLF